MELYGVLLDFARDPNMQPDPLSHARLEDPALKSEGLGFTL